MECIEEERVVVATERKALSRIINEKKKQLLGLEAEMNHAKERVRQLTIGSTRLSLVLCYRRTSNDKVGLEYEGKGK